MLRSLLGGTQIRVHLSAGSLVACEVERRPWHKTTVPRKERFDFARGERAGAMEELARWIPGSAAPRAITWVIGPAHAQYFVLPWSPALIDRGLRDAYARAQFEQLYERDANTAAFSFGPASHGSSQLVSWVSAELPAELTEHARRADCELVSVKPAILTVWDRFRDVLETESGTLCIVDGDRQAVVHHDRKRIKDIVIKPFSKLIAGTVRRDGVFRRFSNESIKLPSDTLPGDLNLPAQNGYVATRDGAYAFALCGAL